MSKSYEEIEEGLCFLVTGAAGFIGSNLCTRLMEKKCKVVGIDNLNNYYDVNLKNDRLNKLEKYENFNFIKADISNRDILEPIFEENKPDIVVNLAAQAGVRYSIENPEAYIQSNVIGFFNVLECCRNHPVKHLVYASSSSVYGGNKKVPFSEDDKVDHPVSLYAATKKSDELMAYCYSKLYQISATGLRFFTVYGPAGRPDMAYFSFAEKIIKGEKIQIFNNGDMYRDFTYIDDIIEGLVRILNNPPKCDEDGVRHKIYNIGNNNPEKLMDFVRILEEALGTETEKVFLPMQPGDVFRTYADITELEKNFDFAPKTSLKEGIDKFVKWFKEYKKL